MNSAQTHSSDNDGVVVTLGRSSEIRQDSADKAEGRRARGQFVREKGAVGRR